MLNQNIALYFIGLRYSDCNKIQKVSILAPEILSDDNFNKLKLLFFKWFTHYTDVIMGAMSSPITSLTIVYSTVYSGADQRKHQSSASLAFVCVCVCVSVGGWVGGGKCFHLMPSSWKNYNRKSHNINCLLIWNIFCIRNISAYVNSISHIPCSYLK